MLFKPALIAFAFLVASTSAEKQVFTATRVYKTITNVAPFFTEVTTTVTWMQGESTVITGPTGPGA
ncbi:hypothetical protein C8J57DRAFT_1722112 [Mycena rebaudengoi]|nr:hypothetical protein C8J57DRAFT_1722112 [Mycena rebaudengoi]